MRKSLKFIGWKVAELTIYVAGFPFFFVGAWALDLSDWCHDRALRHTPLSDTHQPEPK
ncbi:hypothetical protein IVB40_07545 [Bradyrhizobium sp. 40]|uniref:hypothetical protein n=1 Tax=Bradyrhizobium sp. 40 TaxID=2782674 RepID=UPI001FFE6C3D|nr:hypothetical protein [Bradyrhizobium sp. 40]UPJ43914.1 hypothetical protein IVB40_07545 [Bradyrhizobium sp. 40]